jgi:hypothetical protein
MPIVKLTYKPTAITPEYQLSILWAAESLAHSFYPVPEQHSARQKWVEGVLRRYARDWTRNICVLGHAREFYQHWYALDGLAKAETGLPRLKRNDNRDLMLAVNILVHCTLEGLSKAKSTRKLAEQLVAERNANSISSATATVKRAWRKYNTACHFVAAWILVEQSRPDESAAEATSESFLALSIAEHLRRLGETTVPKNGRDPVLDASETWKMPEWFPRQQVELIAWKGGAGIIRLGAATPQPGI